MSLFFCELPCVTRRELALTAGVKPLPYEWGWEVVFSVWGILNEVKDEVKNLI